MSRRRRAAAALALALALAGAASAPAVTVQSEGLRISAFAQLKPYKLPRRTPAPIAVFVAGHLESSAGGVPPQLRRLTVRVNRHGLLQSKGLPICEVPRIQPATTERALSQCGDALIGSGQFWANIVLPDQGAYRTQGRLLIFNGRTACNGADRGRVVGSEPKPAGSRSEPVSLDGSGRLWPSSSRTQGRRGGERTPVRDPNPTDRGQRDAPCQSRPVILTHIYTSHPFNSSFVIPFAIKKVSNGPYGTELSASLPQALGDWSP